MSRYSSLAKNVALLTLARFGTRALSFLLVPLYTSVLTTGEYGVYDLVGNTINILIPLFTQDITDAVLRFSIGSSENKQAVLGVGLKWLLLSLIPMSALLVANNLIGLLPDLRALELLIMLSYASGALSGIVIYYARGLNRFGDVAISSVLCSAGTLVLNIVFLVGFEWGLQGYFLANIIGPFIQSVYILARVKLDGASPLRAGSSLEKDMLSYSRPLIANTVSWWVNNASDRYIITLFCGLSANGVYSVSSKISNILFMFQSVFNQAWTISAVEEFDSEDRNGFFSNMYSLYNCAMTLLCALIILIDIPLAHILFIGDFFEAWRYVPFLTIALVFGASAGYVEGIFEAVKDSKSCAKTTAVGAITNVVMNLILVPFIGALGAAIATTGCYFVTWLLRLLALRKYIRLHIAFQRDCVSYGLLIIQGSLLLLLEPLNHFFMYSVQVALLVLLVVMYRKELSVVIHKVLGAMGEK